LVFQHALPHAGRAAKKGGRPDSRVLSKLSACCSPYEAKEKRSAWIEGFAGAVQNGFWPERMNKKRCPGA